MEGRWSAVILAKAAIEAGGVPILSRSNGWVKSLIAILKRHPDPNTTRVLATSLLTRIFQLTWPYQELVREITTPALPAFIATCLANAQRDGCASAELDAVLEAFCVLVPRHPTVFRMHEAQIRGLVVKILSSTSDYATELKSHQQSAARLLVLLHHCAPKQGGTEAWTASWTSIIETANQTCDMLFRSIVEEPQSDVHQRQPNMSLGEVRSNGQDTWFKPWTGTYAGSERLITLLNILKTQLDTAFSGSVTMSIGLLVQLLARILTLTLEAEADASRFNHQITKDEREAFFHVLPDVHAAALELVASLLRRFGKASMPFAQVLLELTLMVFRAERSINSVRTVAYAAIDLMLDIIGPSLTRPEVAELDPVIEACCTDLSAIATNNTQTPTSTLNTTRNSSPAILPSLQQASSTLLPAFVTKINPTVMPNKSRILIERTAIATRHKEALVACVLNPMTKATGKMGSSLLPILAKMFPGEPEVEALLRPRMPIVVSKMGDGMADRFDDDGGEVGEEQSLLQDDGGSYAFGMQRASDGPRSALDTNGSTIVRGEEEELYSLTPPRDRELNENADAMHDAGLTGPRSANGTKRPPDIELQKNIETSKRTRISPVPTAATSTTKVGAPTRPSDDEVFAAAFTGIAVAAEADAEDGARAAAAVNEKYEVDNDAGSEGSDFEMPPLTLEPDTESEHDDDDEEE